MGLIKDGITEVIATTRYNAAPIGIISRDKRLRMVLFHGSHTEKNVVNEGWIVANFIFDPVVYVRTAFDDLPESDFVEIEVDGMTMHRLEGAEAWTAFRTEIQKNTSEALIIDLVPLHEEIISLTLHSLNRGFNSIVEATVHATRYLREPDPALRRLIVHHTGLVRKCGGQREQEALELLEQYIEI